jgi:hypothetical protein
MTRGTAMIWASVAVAFASLSLGGCDGGTPEQSDQPSLSFDATSNSSTVITPSGCKPPRAARGHLHKVLATFTSAAGQVVFALGPSMADVSSYSVYFNLELPPDDFHETRFDINDGRVVSTLESSAPVPAGVTVTSVGDRAVTMALNTELTAYLASVGDFAVHGGIEVGADTFECRRSVLDPAD